MTFLSCLLVQFQFPMLDSVITVDLKVSKNFNPAIFYPNPLVHSVFHYCSTSVGLLATMLHCIIFTTCHLSYGSYVKQLSVESKISLHYPPFKLLATVLKFFVTIEIVITSYNSRFSDIFGFSIFFLLMFFVKHSFINRAANINLATLS